MLLVGCSGDATRFNALGNPYSTPQRGVDRTATGSIDPRPARTSVNQLSNASAPSYSSQPLSGGNTAIMNKGSVTSALTPPQGAAPQAVASSGGRSGNWVANGGTPIVAAQGETAEMLSRRYGVPQEALLRANGFNSPQQIQPGTRLVVPVYSSGLASGAGAAPLYNHPDGSSANLQPRSLNQQAEEPIRTADASGKATQLHPRPHQLNTEKASGTRVAQLQTPVQLQKSATHTAPEKNALTKTAVVEEKKPASKTVAPTQDLKKQLGQAKAAVASTDLPSARHPAKSAETASKTANIDAAPTAALPPALTTTQAAADSSGSNSTEFRWPAHGRIIQGFKSGGNDGINIAVPEGTAIKAAEGGVVAYAGSEVKGYGNLVLIKHPNGFVSAYANNGELDVKRGDAVKRGQTIAKSGQSGNVTSPQLHFELRKGSTPVDPTGYLANL